MYKPLHRLHDNNTKQTVKTGGLPLSITASRGKQTPSQSSIAHFNFQTFGLEQLYTCGVHVMIDRDPIRMSCCSVPLYTF